MLSKKNRLKNKKEIDIIFAKGYFATGGFLQAKIFFNKLSYSRFAFSVGLGFSKKAVRRNKLKRILRALVGENIKKIKTGLDVVFFIKKGEEIKLRTKSIRPLFKKFLEKNNLLKK